MIVCGSATTCGEIREPLAFPYQEGRSRKLTWLAGRDGEAVLLRHRIRGTPLATKKTESLSAWWSLYQRSLRREGKYKIGRAPAKDQGPDKEVAMVH